LFGVIFTFAINFVNHYKGLNMDDKLQKLTERLYLEGVEQGKKEAGVLLENARNEAGEILKTARSEAEEILARARKEADDYKRNIISDIGISSRQAIASVKQQITDLITLSFVSDSIRPAFKDPEFIKKLLLNLFETWKSQGVSHQDMSVILPLKDQKELGAFFTANIHKMLSDGLEIRFDESVESGFVAEPKDGSYRISFRDQDFERFFVKFLRPKTSQILFGGLK